MFKSGKRRGLRDPSKAEDVMELSMLNELSISLEVKPKMNLFLNLFIVLVEFAAVVVYFVQLEMMSDYNWRLAGFEITYTSIPILPEWSIVMGVFGGYFLFHFIVLVIVEDDRISLLLSVYSAIALLTSITCLIMPFSPKNDNPLLHNLLTAPFIAPLFLRVWYAHRSLSKFVATYFTFHPAVKEIMSQAVFVTAITVSSVGFYQLAHFIGRQEVYSFMDTLYFVIVTVTTMGFGDINPAKSPSMRLGMVVVVVIIFIAMFFLPSLLSKFGELTNYLSRENYYTKNVLHVIIYGELTVSETKLMLREFMSGTRKFDPLNIVIVSLSEFDPEVKHLIGQPQFQGRVTLCVGDPLNKAQIPRFNARKADVVFAVSPRSATAQRGDLQTILRSIAFRRHDSDLPQYLMLKRGSHATAVKRWAFTLVEREKIKFRLLGLSLKLPGFVPFFLNLIKTTDQHDVSLKELKKGWWNQYLRGMSNSLFTMPLPEILEGRTFASVCLIILNRTGMVPIGLVRKENKTVHLCPMVTVLRDSDRLILLAPGNRVVERCFTHFDINDMTGVSGVDAQSDFQHSSDPFANAPKFENPNAGLQGIFKRPKKRRTNIFPFKDHIVVIDMSSSLEVPDLNIEEQVDARRFQALDMTQLLRPFSKGSNTTIVYLSGSDLSEEFYEKWPKTARPIYHIQGSGSDEASLEQANIATAKAVVIFTSLEGECASGDAMIVMVQDLVYRILAKAGREKDVPIVIEVENVDTLYMCNPKMSKLQPDWQMEENYTSHFLTPVFIFGGVISSAMLDTMVYQTYFNEFLPQVIELLLFSKKEMVFAQPVGHFFPATQRGNLDQFIYAELFKLATARGCVPIGLHRVVETDERGANFIGYRYFCTAPHPGLPLKESDIVYFISTQADY